MIAYCNLHVVVQLNGCMGLMHVFDPANQIR